MSEDALVRFLFFLEFIARLLDFLEGRAELGYESLLLRLSDESQRTDAGCEPDHVLAGPFCGGTVASSQ